MYVKRVTLQEQSHQISNIILQKGLEIKSVIFVGPLMVLTCCSLWFPEIVKNIFKTASMKTGFLKATTSRMNGLPKAADVDNFS
jgi:hypothetical protein